MRPLIAINADWADTPFERAQLRPRYIDAVEAAGGIPLVLPPTQDPTLAAAMLDRCDGLLLSGGDDPDPRLYGERPRPEIVPLHPRREAFDLALCRSALARRLPTLAVCAGMQTLAIACGGSLIQHIPAQVAGAIAHAAPSGDPEDAPHAITIQPHSHLARALGSSRAMVNSRHHQAVLDPGRGMRVVARCADDGLIEAIEPVQPGPLCLGVQWHPERSAALAGARRPLFAALVAQSAARHRLAA